MHCARDRAKYWIANMYCTGILGHIDGSKMHWRALRCDVLTAICITLDIDQRIVSTIHTARLGKNILVDQCILQPHPRKLLIWQYVLLPQGCAYWSLQYALRDDCAKYWMKTIVLRILLSKVWNNYEIHDSHDFFFRKNVSCTFILFFL